MPKVFNFLIISAVFANINAMDKDSELKCKKRQKEHEVVLSKTDIFNMSEKIKESNFQLIVQVDGKVRASLLAPIGISQTEAQRLAKKQENVLKYINGKKPSKVIFVPNKLINFVL